MNRFTALQTLFHVSASSVATMILMQACGGGGGGGIGPGTSAFAASDAAPDPIVGVWDSTASVRDCASGAVITSFKGLGMIMSGGTASFTSSRPPSSQSPAFGTWKRESGNDYTLTLVLMRFNPDGSFAGSQKSKISRTLAADGNSFTSTISGQILDATGNVTSTTCATDAGSRTVW